MTKQELVEGLADYTAKKIDNRDVEDGEKAQLMVNAYLFAHVLEYLRPDWYHSEKHAPAFQRLREQFCEYRQKQGRDDRYNGIARACKLLPDIKEDQIYGDPNTAHVEMYRSLVCPSDLGVMMADDAKDKKFARRVIGQYLRRAFPRPAPPTVVLPHRAKPSMAQFTDSFSHSDIPINRAERRALARGEIPFPPSDFCSPLRFQPKIQMEDPHVLDEEEDSNERCQFLHEMLRYVIMLAGNVGLCEMLPEDEDWGYLEHEDGSIEVDLTSCWAREAACLRPVSDACAFCLPEFRRLLSTIYYVRESGLPQTPLYKKTDEDRERYFQMGDSVIMPFVRALENQWVSQRDVAASALYESQTTEAKLFAANQKINDLQSQMEGMSRQATVSPELEAELSHLREVSTKAKQTSKSQEAALERMKEEADNLKREKDRLLRALSESQSQFNILNEQLLDLIEEKTDFVDDEIPETPVASAGIRTKIGESIYHQLSETRLAVVGGHVNTTTTLRDLFPNWKFYETNTMVPEGLTSVDAMVVITSYVSHKTWEQAKSVAKGAGLWVIPVMHNGPVSICRTLAAMLRKKEEVAS